MRAALVLVAAFVPLTVFCSRPFFRAAVFEHRLRASIAAGQHPAQVKAANIKYFEKAIQEAATQNADIIVFNEYGILPYPETRENMKKYAENIPLKFNPCVEKSNERYALTSMSCLAQTYQMYVVINLLDYQICAMECEAHKMDICEEKCPDDGFLIYNTNVAFDREGNIIARYHKMHPYFELVNTPNDPEFVFFDTEFGRFGLIVCFDSVFEESHILVKDYNVDTLIFPTYWFDDIEPLNTIEFQQAWALAHKVNFLAANAQNASTGSLGSGIYSKDLGALVYTFDNDGMSKLLIANVPIKSNFDIPIENSVTVITEDASFPKDVETGHNFPEHCYRDFVGPAQSSNDFRCFKSQTENFTLTKLEKPSGVVESCNNGLCCSLKYVSEALLDVWYLGARNNTNDVKKYYQWWEETCLLLRCDSYQGKECVMQPSTSKTTFQSLELKATFHAEKIYATVSKNKYRLAPKQEWTYSKEGLDTVLKFESTTEEPLLKAVLLGRNYKLDPPFVPWYQYTIPQVFFM